MNRNTIEPLMQELSIGFVLISSAHLAVAVYSEVSGRKMKKYFLFLLIVILILFLGLMFRPDNIKVLEVSGFEAQEKALNDKYANRHSGGKGYTKEELESIKKDVNDLIKLKREKARQERTNASSSVNE